MRPHTGRRRNEAARAAVHEAALRILREEGYGALAMEHVARSAGVSKQTLYRWWSSPAAIVLEAATEQALSDVPAVETDDAAADVEAFLVTTYERAEAWAPILRAMAAAAQREGELAESFRTFTARRRAILRGLLSRAGALDPELSTDFAYGVLWYRVLDSHGPLDAALARAVAERLLHGRRTAGIEDGGA